MKSCPFVDAKASPEARRAFQGGRLDALFCLVGARRLSLEDVALMEGMSIEAAKDLMVSWQYFRYYEEVEAEGI